MEPPIPFGDSTEHMRSYLYVSSKTAQADWALPVAPQLTAYDYDAAMNPLARLAAGSG
jgi:hypothetical protein